MANSLAKKHHISAPLVHGRKWELDLSLADFCVRTTTSLGDATEPCICLYHHMGFAVIPVFCSSSHLCVYTAPYQW